MSGKVISVFAGLGKTTVGKKYSNVCDLQSSPYRFDYTDICIKDYENKKYDQSRTPNPEWPNNYLKAIEKSIQEYDITLVPSNQDIRGLLVKNNIDFMFILPSKDKEIRKKLLKIYEKRGNNAALVKDVMYNFDNWSRNQKDYSYSIVVLDKDKYLEDLLLEKRLINNS